MKLSDSEKEIVLQALYMAAGEGFDEAGELLDRLRQTDGL